MKVLYLIDTLKTGGKERQLIELIKGLIPKKQINIKLVVMNKDVHYSELVDLNIDVKFLIRSYRWDIRIFFELYHLCKTFKPDIIHTWDTMTSFYSLPIAKWFKIKLINGSIRNATPITLFSFEWFFSRLTFPFFDKIISNSLAGLKGKKISRINGHYIHNGYDFNRTIALKPIKEIKETLKITKKIVIGMVASFTIKKDWKSFFESALIILTKRDDVVFLAVGDGPLLGEMKLFVGKEMEDRIIFLSNYHPVEEIINIFDIGMLITDTCCHQEGISNSIMEYMALAKPVIATIGGGTKEIIEDGNTGLLVPNRSSDEIVKKIIYLLEHTNNSAQIANNGQRFLIENINYTKMINSYIDLYYRKNESLN